MSSNTIASLTEGKVTSITGRITEVDERPISISLQDGKIVSIYHVTITDATMSTQATVWDRNADFVNFRLGDVVTMENVTAKPCKEGFTEYGPLALNFGRTSRIGPPVSAIAQGDVARFPKVSKRQPKPTPAMTRSTPASQSSVAVRTPVKRVREEEDCVDGCATPQKPFCSKTGKPHGRRCDLCRENFATHPFCAETGLPHV